MFGAFYFGQAYFADGPPFTIASAAATPTGHPGTTVND